MGITSVNLSAMPFIGSCDSTRTQMAAKQMAQSLTHPNCNIPYVISDEYRYLVDNNKPGIYKAPDDGTVIFKNPDLMILYFKNLDKVEVRQIPRLKKTTGTFASQLRFSLEQDNQFHKDDILYSYDCFRAGVPSFGYNVFTGYFNFFGFNHEDGLTISESFADRARCQFVETVYVPIFEYTMLQPIYHENENFKYFPEIGQKVNDNIVAVKLQPKASDSIYNAKDLKQRMMMMLKGMSISDLLNIKSKNISQFIIDPIKTKIDDGIVTGIKVHRLRKKKEVSLVEKDLEELIEKLHNAYVDKHLIKSFGDLSEILGEQYATKIFRQHLVYKEDGSFTNRKDLTGCVYLLEIEVSAEHHSVLGDKFCNRFANKGVASLILPDELRPIALSTQNPIDLVFNPFGVFSRMNLSQLLEGMVAKNVMACDKYIRSNPEDVVNTVGWLNDSVLKYFHDDKYYNDVKTLLQQIEYDKNVRNKFIDQVVENNLFVEAPSFSEVDTRQIFKNSIPPNEDVLIKRETLMYLREKLKVDMPFPAKDVTLKNIFCAPIYIMKLYKLVSHIISARDLGPCKYITKQPLKGRAAGGGSRVGQMELEGILAHGCDKAFKELLTVKSDYEAGKKDLIDQLTKTGEYHFNGTSAIEGGTKRVVSTLIKFLQD